MTSPEIEARAMAIRARLCAHGQDHVLRFFEQLDGPAKEKLLEQVEGLDLQWLDRVLGAGEAVIRPEEIRPCGEIIRPGHAREAEALECGRQALARGQVAVLLVAGGSGTRLGFDGPKGAFPLGPVSGKTLFQLHAEQVLAQGRRGGATPTLLLMTSADNDAETRRIWQDNALFGLKEEGLFIFAQDEAPAVDEQGKLLLADRDRLVSAPNGNGGLFAALARSGALEVMEQRGIDCLSYVQVDNALSPSCDERFIGFHQLLGSAFSCKGISKRDPGEKVGSYALVDGRLRIVEYFELPDALASARGEDGALLYGLSNPGMFLWSRDFLVRQAARQDLPYHRAHKKIPHLDTRGALVSPEQPNGYKLESFAMDTLPEAERTVLLACDRRREFAPVKNRQGQDSPETARKLLMDLHRQWLLAAGATIKDPWAKVEISALYAADEAELKRRLPRGLVVEEDLYLR